VAFGSGPPVQPVELGVCVCKPFTAEAKYNSGAVRKRFCRSLLPSGAVARKYSARSGPRDVSGDPYIDPPAGSHRESA
jgi:hypothetical protein